MSKDKSALKPGDIRINGNRYTYLVFPSPGEKRLKKLWLKNHVDRELGNLEESLYAPLETDKLLCNIQKILTLIFNNGVEGKYD